MKAAILVCLWLAASLLFACAVVILSGALVVLLKMFVTLVRCLYNGKK